MFCNKCGRILEENTKFCGGCGTPISFHNNIQQNTVVTKNNNPNQNNLNYNQTYKNYDNIIHQNMKKYAIASIIIPIISIIIYWNIGLSIYIALLLSGLGFSCAKKGKLYNKTVSTIGYVLNGILIGIIFFMFFAILITSFA